MKSFLTVDWGGTALKGYFYSSKSSSLHHFQFPSMNLKVASDSDINQCLRNISSIVTDAGENTNEVIWIIGAAGASTNEAKERMSALLHSDTINVYPDYLCNFKAALGKADGCVSVNGTGSILFARSKNDLQRFGGWGYLFDTTPSGAYFGKLAIEGALLSFDDEDAEVFQPFLKSVEIYKQNEQDSTKLKNVKKSMSSKKYKINQAELLQYIYKNKNMQTFFAQFSKTITKEFERDNIWATNTILASIDMLVDQIEDASLMFNNDKNVKLCGIGGLWTEWKPFKKLVEANITERKISIDVVTPLYRNEWGPALHYFEEDDFIYQKLIRIIEKVSI